MADVPKGWQSAVASIIETPTVALAGLMFSNLLERSGLLHGSVLSTLLAINACSTFCLPAA